MKTHRQRPGDRRPATGDRRPATGDRRPATGDRRPATGDRRPATGDPATGDRRPAIRHYSESLNRVCQPHFRGGSVRRAAGTPQQRPQPEDHRTRFAHDVHRIVLIPVARTLLALDAQDSPASPVPMPRTVSRARRERKTITFAAAATPSPGTARSPSRSPTARAAEPSASSAHRPAAMRSPVRDDPVTARGRGADSAAGCRVEPRACPGAPASSRQPMLRAPRPVHSPRQLCLSERPRYRSPTSWLNAESAWTR